MVLVHSIGESVCTQKLTGWSWSILWVRECISRDLLDGPSSFSGWESANPEDHGDSVVASNDL